jgi:hypothetical protein
MRPLKREFGTATMHWSRREDRRWRSPVAIEGFGVRYQRLVLIGFA